MSAQEELEQLEREMQADAAGEDNTRLAQKLAVYAGRIAAIREAMRKGEAVLNYEPVYDYAKRHRLNYNDLGTLLRSCVVAPPADSVQGLVEALEYIVNPPAGTRWDTGLAQRMEFARAVLAARKPGGKCPQCDGRGWTEEGDPETGHAPFDCDRCGGTGKSEGKG